MSRPTPERIAFFLPSLAGGGAQRVFLHLAGGFAERGYEVHLVLARAEGPYLPQVPPCVRMVDLGASRVLTSLPALSRYLRDERPYALLSALDHANAVAACARRLARSSTRVIVTVHSTPSRVVAHARTVRAKLLPFWTRFFYRWADAVVAVSQGVADELVHYVRIPAEKVKVIYNPIVTPELFQKAAEPLEHPWFQEGQPPVILGVGRLTKPKDFPTLIRAFALVRQQRPARLMILGEGEERPELERLIRELGLEEDVALPGFVQNPYPYMKHAAVFVLSSRWEGLPTVLVEALALGAPVVSTNCPSGAAEILDNGRLGILVEVGDCASLARAIDKSLDCPRRLTMAQDYQRFTVEHAVLQYENLAGLAQ
ncbi:MAG: glycosyltransferase [bacterium]|nr:glycosyltransferase [bacterium]